MGAVGVLFLEYGCKWKLVAGDELDPIEVEGKFPFYKCKMGHDLSYMESAMINDFDTIIFLSNYFQKMLVGKEVCKMTFQLFCDIRTIGIARAVENKERITELDLSNNKIKSPGAIAISRLLHTNPTLKILNLSKVLAKYRREQYRELWC
jgi:hypothetical protein